MHRVLRLRLKAVSELPSRTDGGKVLYKFLAGQKHGRLLNRRGCGMALTVKQGGRRSHIDVVLVVVGCRGGSD